MVDFVMEQNKPGHTKSGKETSKEKEKTRRRDFKDDNDLFSFTVSHLFGLIQRVVYWDQVKMIRYLPEMYLQAESKSLGEQVRGSKQYPYRLSYQPVCVPLVCRRSVFIACFWTL